MFLIFWCFFFTHTVLSKIFLILGSLKLMPKRLNQNKCSLFLLCFWSPYTYAYILSSRCMFYSLNRKTNSCAAEFAKRIYLVVIYLSVCIQVFVLFHFEFRFIIKNKMFYLVFRI